MTPDLDVEAAIVEEMRAVDEVIARLRLREPLAQWPIALQAAFALALADHGVESIGWQVTALRRHLFGPLPYDVLDPIPSNADPKLAERLRADLLVRTPLRCARYLIRG